MRSAVTALDHLVLATPDLAATAAWFHAQTGIAPSPGGPHIGRGTRNVLCSLGPTSYLEIIGPDLEQADVVGPRPFGIDDLSEPAIVAWAIAVADIDAAVSSARSSGFDPGEPAAMQRRRPDGVLLSWRLTTPTGVTIPFLIDWGTSPHPAAGGAPGLELVDLHVRHLDPDGVSATLGALGVSMPVVDGPEALMVRLRGPAGGVDFA